MKLFHTSPTVITEIKEDYSYFSGALFFSSDPYFMTASKNPVIYSLEISEDDIIDVRDLEPTKEDILNVSDYFNNVFDIQIDEDQAIDLLTESDTYEIVENISEDLCSNPDDAEEVAELSWRLQGWQAKIAKTMGFVAVESEDEQGAVWAVNMINRETLLNLED